MTREAQTLHPALVEAIEIDRELFNQQFKLATHQKRIEPKLFFAHLAERVNPIVAAVHDEFPERSRIVTSELYKISLDLFGASVLGADAELPILDRLWRELLPTIPQLVARDPHRLVGSLCNALLQVCEQTERGAATWLKELQDVAPRCLSPQQLLDAGQVLSWTCGMAQYRNSALQLARKAGRDLLIRVFKLPPSIEPQQLTESLDQWEKNPWRSIPEKSSESNSAVKQVAMVGAFRGFGGAFLSPPTVVLEQRKLFVEDSHSIWQVFADRFGNYFHRVGESNGRKRRAKASNQDAVGISRDGTVRWGGRSFPFPSLADSTSAAFDGVTLAVTIPNSFHIFLLAEHG